MKTTSRTFGKFGSLVLLGAVSSVVGSAASVEAPKPPAVSAIRPIASTYEVVTRRSIFSRDGRPATVVFTRTKPSTGWNLPATTSTAPSTPVVIIPDPEANFVLRGIGVQDGVVTAFFEQTSESKGYLRHVGDSIARGKIMAMSLDGVDYDLNGKPARIQIGQNLDGKIVDAGHSLAGGSSDRTSHWIHHDTPGAAPAMATAAPSAEDPRASRERERGGWGDNKEKDRSEREKGGYGERARTDGGQGGGGQGGGRETGGRSEPRPDEPPAAGPGPGPGPGGDGDDLPPVIIIDPN